MNNIIALNEYLKPLSSLLSDPGISEISINYPGYVFIEKDGKVLKEAMPELTQFHLEGLSALIARFSNQHLSQQTPLLSASLPDGHRIQIVLPPCSADNYIALSIRKNISKHLSFSDYIKLGAFTQTVPYIIKNFRNEDIKMNVNDSLFQLFHKKKYAHFLQEAIKMKKNILISGATSSGKTTLLNTCIQQIPLNERIITLEDVRELEIPHSNKVHLLASRDNQGISRVTMQQLITACLRLRPDRIIMGEIRGPEALDYCNASATGHDGSLSSIHASTPFLAFSRLVHMIQQNPGIQFKRDDILNELFGIIDVIVQIKKKLVSGKEQRIISDIYYAEYGEN